MVEVKRRVLFVCTSAILTFAPSHSAKDFIREKVYFFSIITVYRVCLDIAHVMKFDITPSHVKRCLH